VEQGRVQEVAQDNKGISGEDGSGIWSAKLRSLKLFFDRRCMESARSIDPNHNYNGFGVT